MTRGTRGCPGQGRDTRQPWGQTLLSPASSPMSLLPVPGVTSPVPLSPCHPLPAAPSPCARGHIPLSPASSPKSLPPVPGVTSSCPLPAAPSPFFPCQGSHPPVPCHPQPPAPGPCPLCRVLPAAKGIGTAAPQGTAAYPINIKAGNAPNPATPTGMFVPLARQAGNDLQNNE